MPRRHLLLPAAAGLLAVLAWEWRAIPDETATKRLPPTDISDLAAAPTRILPDRLARIVLTRPLMTPTRRTAAIVGAPSEEWEALPRLAGILITPARRAAVFSTSLSGVFTRDQGQAVGAYLVEQVRPDGVTLRIARREIILHVRPGTTARAISQEPPAESARAATRTADGQHEE